MDMFESIILAVKVAVTKKYAEKYNSNKANEKMRHDNDNCGMEKGLAVGIGGFSSIWACFTDCSTLEPNDGTDGGMYVQGQGNGRGRGQGQEGARVGTGWDEVPQWEGATSSSSISESPQGIYRRSSNSPEVNNNQNMGPIHAQAQSRKENQNQNHSDGQINRNNGFNNIPKTANINSNFHNNNNNCHSNNNGNNDINNNNNNNNNTNINNSHNYGGKEKSFKYSDHTNNDKSYYDNQFNKLNQEENNGRNKYAKLGM